MRYQKEFDEFVSEMKKIIEQHESMGKEPIELLSDHLLVDGLMQEVHEFEIKNDPEYELIDIANSCFLLWAKRNYYS